MEYTTRKIFENYSIFLTQIEYFWNISKSMSIWVNRGLLSMAKIELLLAD